MRPTSRVMVTSLVNPTATHWSLADDGAKRSIQIGVPEAWTSVLQPMVLPRLTLLSALTLIEVAKAARA